MTQHKDPQKFLTETIAEQANGAVFSSDQKYRYVLWRRWESSSNLILFVGLNPSTADEKVDDSTIRRFRGFSERLGADGFIAVNLFAYRSKDPKVLKLQLDPVGRENDDWILAASSYAYKTIACWGNHGLHHNRCNRIWSLLTRPEAFRITKLGQPEHLLYMPYNSSLGSYTGTL
jgi:hypothetical protein